MNLVFFRNRHLLILTIVAIFVGGLSAYSTLPRQEDPRLTNWWGFVQTAFPGASADRVEALVTDPLERVLREVSEIKTLDSTSRRGISIIVVELHEHVLNTAPVWSRIRDKIDDFERLRPEGALKPELDHERTESAFSHIVALTWSQSEEPNLAILGRWAEELADRLRSVPGTDLARVYGAAEEEISVTVDPAELITVGLTSQELARQIATADAKVPAGVLRARQREAVIEVDGEFRSDRRIAQIPLESNGEELGIRVEDIAEVKRSFRTPHLQMGSSNGQRAVFIASRMDSGRRMDQWAERINSTVAQLASEAQGSFTVSTMFDQSHYVDKRMSSLGRNLVLGAAIVILVLFLMMGWRSALLVSCALPLATGILLFVLRLLEIPLHQMSVTGMIIALGLLIDNAIVMVEDVRRRLATSADRGSAILESFRHLFVPLLGSTATTVLAFMPILLLSGAVGQFVGTIAVSVIIAIISSFAVSMLLLPALTAIFLKRSQLTSGNWWQAGLQVGFITRSFRWLLERSVRFPVLGLALGALLPLAGFLRMDDHRQQFFPTTDRDQLHIEVRLPGSASIDHTYGFIQTLQDHIETHEAFSSSNWLVGGSFPSVYYNLMMDEDRSPEFAQGIVRAKSAAAARALTREWQHSLPAAYPEAQIIVRGFGQGPPVEAPVEIRIYGNDLNALRSVGEEVRLEVARQPSVLHTRMSLSGGQPKLDFVPNEDEVRRAGLSLVGIAQQLESNLEGSAAGSVLEDTESLPVRVRYPKDQRADLDPIGSLNLLAPNQQDWIPLSALGEIEVRPQLDVIARRNGERFVVVHGYLEADALPLEVTSRLQDELQSIALPGGTRLEFGGENEEQGEAVAGLLTYLPVLLVLMVATVVLSFRSFAVSILLGSVALLTLGLGSLAIAVAGFPYGFMAMIGTAGLIGVAVNDSIVVLAAIRENPKARSGSIPEIVDAAMGTTRHVFATTLTTVGGFLPLLLSAEGFWPPLAVVIAGGVAGATILALLWVPSAYRAGAWLGERFRRKRVDTEAVASPAIAQWVGPILLASLLLTGCSVGPDHEEPTVAELPDSYRTPAAQDVPVDWWNTFNDPVLTRLLRDAVAANHDVRIAQERVLEARALAGIARAGLGPSVDLSATFSEGDRGVRNTPPGVPEDLAQVAVGASWEIDVFGGVRRRVEGARARVGLAEELRRGTVLSLLSEVAATYFELRGALRELAVVQENIRIQRDVLELTQARRESGLASDLEEQQSLRVLATTEASLPAIRERARRTAHRLSVLCGEPPRSRESLITLEPRLPNAPDFEGAGVPADLLRRRPDLRAAERSVAATNAAIGVATADLYPRFFLLGSAGFENAPSADLTSPLSRALSLAPTMRWSIFRSGAIRANIAAAEARHRVALLQFEKSVLKAVEDVETRWEQFVQEQATEQALTRATTAARAALERSESLYRDGLENFLTVLDTERALNQVEVEQVRSRTRILISLSRLYAALGGGWEAWEPEVTANEPREDNPDPPVSR